MMKIRMVMYFHFVSDLLLIAGFNTVNHQFFTVLILFNPNCFFSISLFFKSCYLCYFSCYFRHFLSFLIIKINRNTAQDKE